MKYREVTWSELGWDREPERSDNGKGEQDLNWKVECTDIVGRLPMNTIFGDLDGFESTLADLLYFQQKSNTEIAEFLGKEQEDVDYQIEKLRAKVRYRARVIVKGTAIEEALVKMNILSANEMVVRKSPDASEAVHAIEARH